ncbi:MAG: TolC family protein [Thermodesulfovibrionales bacterium]|nr:TolC family protein [Thermodesulfovibrionales bacterium]
MRIVILAPIISGLLLLVLPYSAGAAEGSYREEAIKTSEVLNLKRCVEIALQKHPDIVAATGEVEVNQSRIGQAKANYYPQVDLSSGYKKYSPVSKASNNSLDEYRAAQRLNRTSLILERPQPKWKFRR